MLAKRFNGLARFLACLLAVLMLSQAAAVSPAAFADGDGSTVEKQAATLVQREREDRVSFDYSTDGNYIKKLLIDEFVDFEASNLPQYCTVDDFTVKSGRKDVCNKKGVSNLKAADKVDISIQFKGNDTYTVSNTINVQVTVNEAKTNVKVNSQSIYAGETPKDFVTVTSPSGSTSLGNYVTIYSTAKASRDQTSGMVNGLAGNIYIELAESTNPIYRIAWTAIMAGVVVEGMQEAAGHESYKIADLSTEGVTVSDFKLIMPYFVNYLNDPKTKKSLSYIDDYDSLVSTVSKVSEIVQGLPEFTDDSVIYFNTSPKHVGVYSAIVYTFMNDNHENGLGTGVLTVKANIKGTSIDLNPILDRRVISAGQAAEIANGDKGAVAVLSCDGETVDQSNLRFVYSGITNKLKLYTSTSEFPTDPGRYTVTVMTVGGDYLAAPVTCSFRITK